MQRITGKGDASKGRAELDMRPVSAHLAVWGLPTIKEGHEDHVLDTNQQDSLSSLSSASLEVDCPDNYLRSISQLARPAFCSPDSNSVGKQQQDTVNPPRHQSSHSEGRFTVTMETNGCLSNARKYLNEGCIRKPGSLAPLPSLNNTCLRNSCQALHPGRPSIADALTFPPKGLKSPRSRQPPRRAPNDTRSPTALQRDRAIARVNENSIISHWMADCRDAWKETKFQACMLPAIAEI